MIHTRNGSNKAGPQSGKLVPCAMKPDNHGFHPEYEDCAYCEPAPPTLRPEVDYMNLPDTSGWDTTSNKWPWPSP